MLRFLLKNDAFDHPKVPVSDVHAWGERCDALVTPPCASYLLGGALLRGPCPKRYELFEGGAQS